MQTYAKIFPKLFKPIESMPPELQKHLRHQLYSLYHKKKRVFYNKEDAWNIPTEVYEQTTQWIEPYYILINSSFILMSWHLDQFLLRFAYDHILILVLRIYI